MAACARVHWCARALVRACECTRAPPPHALRQSAVPSVTKRCLQTAARDVGRRLCDSAPAHSFCNELHAFVCPST
eukprot:5630628-Pleurochrysis_carterae.AAC.2